MGINNWNTIRQESNCIEWIEKVADRIIYGTDNDWNMNIHRFDWVPGVGLYGIWTAYKKTKKKKYLNFLLNWTDRHIGEAYQMETVNSTAPMLTILELYKTTRNDNYLYICQNIADYFVENAPITIDGGLEHTVTESGEIFNDQMWADTLFMTCIFLVRFGEMVEEEKYIDFAVMQLSLHYLYLWNEQEHLFYHGWNGALRNHMSGVYWGRANAWVICSTVEILNAAGPFEERKKICSLLREHADALASWQRKDGLFGTIINDSSSYSELSASAGIACGIQRAVKFGYLNESAAQIAKKTFQTLPEYIDEMGNVMNVSTGTPIMPSPEAYKKIKLCPTLYGQAFMIMALAEME